MRDRAAQILKIVCLGLAALLLVQLVKAGFRANPLAGVSIPQVPSLPADTNAPPKTADKGPAKPPGTNSPAMAISSNAPGAAVGTNHVAHQKTKPSQSNAVPSVAESTGTNATSDLKTNVTATASNAAPVAIAAESPSTNNPATNISATASAETNITTAKVAAGTNVVGTNSIGTNTIAAEPGKTNLTNSAIAKAGGAKKPPSMPSQMAGGPMMGGPGGAKPAKLAPEIQARVDRVVESEIFAPIPHPMPMALLGIAGKSAFLRSPSGQTGLVKEGEDLGEIKLLRIGINRVLVEQDGQKKELMIFSGLGGESLLPKPTATSDETTKH